MVRLLTFGFLLMLGQWGIGGSEEIEAIDDFAVTTPGESVSLNVLSNDSGDGIRVTQIVEPPQCGILMDVQENGEVVYVANPGTNCSFDTFIYEIEDNCGEKETAMVTIAIIQPSTDLIVEVERDCASVETNMEYTLNIAIWGGFPPFIINMNEHQDTLQDQGIISYKICEGTGYEITVIDSVGAEFYEMGGEIACTGQYAPCEFGTPNFDYETTCLGNGEVEIKLIDEYVEAHYTNNQGVKYALNKVDTIPTISYLTLQITECMAIDTFLNCLSANDDFIEVHGGIVHTFNVLDNDFGQNMEVTAITSSPQCGTLYSWSADGAMSYGISSVESCTQDEFIYELQNDVGEKATAKVQIQEINEQPMYLDWNFDCSDANCEFDFFIVGGVPPYWVGGSFNDLVESGHFTLTVNCWDALELEVLDSFDEVLHFELNTWVLCYGDEDCYEPESINLYLEIECLGEQGGVVHYLSQMQNPFLKQAFWIDSNNKYHELHDLDTIPDHSYYYLEMQNLGHIDGYVDCQTEEIEAVDDFAHTFIEGTLTINVLDNDKGDGIRVTQIVESPPCGDILEWSEEGEVIYVADTNMSCTFDTFNYEITDNLGEKDTAIVTISIEQLPYLNIEIEVDCSNNPYSETCYYCRHVNIFIGGDSPPFEVSGFIDTILYENAYFSMSVCKDSSIDLSVTDSIGQTYTDSDSSLWCSHERQCFPLWKPYQLNCNGDGTVRVDFLENTGLEEAYWTATDGHRKALEDGDVIPNKSYLQFFQMCGFEADTLVNCFSASDDWTTVGVGRSRTIRVLENDFGESLEVESILDLPICGELKDWSEDGVLEYRLPLDATCGMDSLSYVLTNDLGWRDTAVVRIGVEENLGLIVNWEVECVTEAQGLASVTIEDGTPPYTISGVLNEVIDGHSFQFPLTQNANSQVTILDANGDSATIFPQYWGVCSEECYERGGEITWQNYTTECLEDGSASIFVGYFIDDNIEQSFWIDAEGAYHLLDVSDTDEVILPNYSYFYIETKLFGHIDGFVNCPTMEVEAVDDFMETALGEIVTINVLENDKGDGIRLIEIIELPQCGLFVDIQENGLIGYFVDATFCNFDTFSYEIEDNWGNRDTAKVEIAIQESDVLIVETERDCTSADITGTYFVHIAIYSGLPPFVINFSGIQDTLQEPGYFSYEIENGVPYELYISDSNGQEFYETGGEVPCPHWWDICEETQGVNSSLTCLDNGKLAIEINSHFETASYINSEGKKHPLNAIDTIPNPSYLTITLSNNYVWDTLLNCLSANDDFLEVLEEETITFNVLDNDFGQNIQVTDIIEMPQCGILLEWLPDGTMTYQMGQGESCIEAEIVYEVENDLEEKILASIYFQKVSNRPMHLDWNLDCDNDWQCEIDINIIDGNPPYAVSGYLNEQDLEASSFSLPFECGNHIELEITDNDGEIVFFELDDYYHICFGIEDCYEPRFIHQFLEIECLGEQGGVVHYLHRMSTGLLERAFYIDSNNQYHELQEFDTIPNHSYYYLKLKYFGHIDGYVDCLMTNIENTGENSSNHSLQLYPNPNNGQFSFQLQTPPNRSLQSFPVRMYDIAGRLVKQSAIQGNCLETIELENVSSGLYILQVVLEEEVIVERFLVE